MIIKFLYFFKKNLIFISSFLNTFYNSYYYFWDNISSKRFRKLAHVGPSIHNSSCISLLDKSFLWFLII